MFCRIAVALLVTGCAPRAAPIGVSGVPLVRQESARECGEAALAMVLAHWGAERADAPDDARAGDLKDLALARGLHAFVIEGRVADLDEHLTKGRPVIAGVVRRNGLTHYEVVVGLDSDHRWIATLDPARGKRRRSLDAFVREWSRSGYVTLVVFPK